MRRHLIAAMAGLLAWAPFASAQPPAPPFTGAEQDSILRALQMRQAGAGRVVNACEDAVVPQYYRADFGGAVGLAALVVIPGGSNSATCYGDTPGDLRLMKREGAGWRAVFAGNGYVAILPTQHAGVHDLALGGPGFSFPVYVWNGRDFAATQRTISDAEFGRYPSLP